MGDVNLPFFLYLCKMKEVLYKREFVKYECNSYECLSPIDDKGRYADSAQLYHPPTKKHPLFLYQSAHNNEEFFSENFQNPMTLVSRYNALVVIERNGDKISMKLFDGFTHRKPGVSWFKKSKNVIFLTVNTKTGDVYSGGIVNYHLKRKCKKYIRRNYFADGGLCSFQNSLRNQISRFNQNDVTGVTSETIRFFLNMIDPNDSFTSLKPSERLFKFHLDKKGYKYPNNFNVFMHQWLGPDIKKCLKRNNKRVIDAFMDLYGIQGKKIKKILHKTTNFNTHAYNVASDLFGVDWLNQDEELLLACFDTKHGMTQAPEIFKELITNDELKRVFTLFKQVVQYENMNSYTLNDHIRMYCELRELGENIKWLSSTDNINLFREEHLDWTDKLQHYRQGSYYRIYPEYTYEMINKPLEVNGEVYTPVLLTDSSSYNEESSYQSNCVKGYVGKCQSMIVSLRRGEGKDMERATLEYELSYKKELEIVRIERVQSLGRFNQQLPSDWTDALLRLDERMLYYVKDEKFDTVKIKKKCANGVELESTSVWDDMGRLRWNKKAVEKTDRYYYNNEFFE